MRNILTYKSKPFFVSKQTSGFTLLETAVYLTILGLFTVIAIESYRNYTNQNMLNENSIKQTKIRTALSNFVVENGRLPRPARPDTSPTDSNAGEEISDSIHAIPIGGNDGVINVIAGKIDAKWPNDVSMPDADFDPDPVLTGGSLPYKALRLTYDDTIDAWGRQLSYTVSAYMTDEDKFHYDGGTIGYQGYRSDDSTTPATWIMDNARHSKADGSGQEGNFLFAVISHGPDGKGTYDYSGNLVSTCTGSELDIENCDGDADFINADWETPIYSRGNNSDYFDDGFSLFSISRDSDKWSYKTTTEMQNKSGGKVGIGTDDPQAKLHISGNLKALDAHVERYCSEDDDCFKSEIIGGAEGAGAIQCEGGLMQGVADSDVTCAREVNTDNIVPTTCDPGFIAGFEADGTVICQE
jgi:type II secretory pathway pseudopilin PulG